LDDKNKSDDETRKEDFQQKDDESTKQEGKEFNEKNELEKIATDMAQMKKDYERILKEHEKLVEYKKNKEEEEHLRNINAKIAEFEALADEDVKDIRENAQNYTIQEAEDKLFAILGRKQSGKQVENKFAKFYVNSETKSEEVITTSYDHYFTKHLKK
jgi:hypothetical protein